MDNGITVTAEQVESFPELAAAIDEAVRYSGTVLFEDKVLEGVIPYALELYHRLGRADVDEMSEMLGSTIAMEAQIAEERGVTGAELRAHLVDVVVDVGTMTVMENEGAAQ